MLNVIATASSLSSYIIAVLIRDSDILQLMPDVVSRINARDRCSMKRVNSFEVGIGLNYEFLATHNTNKASLCAV